MKLQRLKELALGATQGEWHEDLKGQIWRRPISELYQNGGGVAGDKPIAWTDRGWYGEDTDGYPYQENAYYIAAACPANILPFLESYEELLAALKRIEEYGHGIGHGSGYTCANIAEQAIANAEKLK